jgi:hypothetical protein
VSVLATGPDEAKWVPVDKQSSRSRKWRVERYGSRYLFIGPAPSGILFWSCSAPNWREAAEKVRARWSKMDNHVRKVYYGAGGIFATEFPEKKAK